MRTILQMKITVLVTDEFWMECPDEKFAELTQQFRDDIREAVSAMQPLAIGDGKAIKLSVQEI